MVLKSIRAFVATLLITGGVNVAAADSSQIDAAAAVAQSYFDALRAGDTKGLLSLFAGDERSRSEAQLSDPAYSQLLSDRYRNVRFEVTDGGVQYGISFVDITAWLNDVESFNERLVLHPSDDPADASLHIVARKELLD